MSANPSFYKEISSSSVHFLPQPWRSWIWMGLVFSGWCSFSLQVPPSEKKLLHLHRHPSLPTNPSMIFCTPRAAPRITASLFYSLPEPWRMEGVMSGWHHRLPNTPYPCWHRLLWWASLEQMQAPVSMLTPPTLLFSNPNPYLKSPVSTWRALPGCSSSRGTKTGLQAG